MKIFNFVLHSIPILLFFGYSSLQASVIELDLTKANINKIPIAISFNCLDDCKNSNKLIQDIVSKDLDNSGEFTASNADSANSNYNVVGNIKLIKFSANNEYKINFQLKSSSKKISDILLNKSYNFTATQIRTLAHTISNSIYQYLTGKNSVFNLKIAYILTKHDPYKKRKIYQIQIADYDGYSPKTVFESYMPVMSLSWSKDNNKIAYVSFENKEAEVFIQDLKTGNRKKLMAGNQNANTVSAPAWSSDSKKLAIVVGQKNQTPEIYIVNINGDDRNMEQITNEDAINTEPSWSDDDNYLVFTSDKTMGMNHPQIYLFDIKNKKPTRITYMGNYNAKATFTPDNKSIVFLHKEAETGYSIATQKIGEYSIKKIVENDGNINSVSVAPNGKMFIYGTSIGKKKIIGMVGANNTITHIDNNASLEEPVWENQSNN